MKFHWFECDNFHKGLFVFRWNAIKSVKVSFQIYWLCILLYNFQQSGCIYEINLNILSMKINVSGCFISLLVFSFAKSARKHSGFRSWSQEDFPFLINSVISVWWVRSFSEYVTELISCGCLDFFLNTGGFLRVSDCDKTSGEIFQTLVGHLYQYYTTEFQHA